VFIEELCPVGKAIFQENLKKARSAVKRFFADQVGSTVGKCAKIPPPLFGTG
jgi:hypothetical protein